MPFEQKVPDTRRGPGRPKGSTNKSADEARAFARGILDSEDYRQSLEARIRNGTLAPRIEELLYHYAYGKPSQTIELHQAGDQGHLQAMSKSELLDRAEALLSLAKTVALLEAPSERPLAEAEAAPDEQSVM